MSTSDPFDRLSWEPPKSIYHQPRRPMERRSPPALRIEPRRRSSILASTLLLWMLRDAISIYISILLLNNGVQVFQRVIPILHLSALTEQLTQDAVDGRFDLLDVDQQNIDEARTRIK